MICTIISIIKEKILIKKMPFSHSSFTATWKLFDGTLFSGTDVIRLKDKRVINQNNIP
jgi:hypothetical protein